MSEIRGLLSLRYGNCIFGNFEYTEDTTTGENTNLEIMEIDFLKLIAYCIKRIEPITKMAYCKGTSAKELCKLTSIINCANIAMAKKYLNNSNTGRELSYKQPFLKRQHLIEDESYYQQFYSFLLELAGTEYQAFKKRQMTGRKVALKKGITLTQKPYQAGRVML